MTFTQTSISSYSQVCRVVWYAKGLILLPELKPFCGQNEEISPEWRNGRLQAGPHTGGRRRELPGERESGLRAVLHLWPRELPARSEPEPGAPGDGLQGKRELMGIWSMDPM